jgi:hypothetical protein
MMTTTTYEISAAPLPFCRLLVSAVILQGCASGGLKFINTADNLPVPPALEERTLWKDTAIIQYRLDGLSGYVLERPNADADWRRDIQILPERFSPVSVPITDGQFYHSIVDSSIASSGNGKIPILSIAGNLSSTQKMDLTITDAQLIYIDDNLIPWDKIHKYLDANQAAPGSSRVWVQAVMLTQMIFAVATETSADSTVSGTAFQVDGKVYNSAATTQRQPCVTMLLVDLNSVASKEKTTNTTVGELLHPTNRSVPALSISSLRFVDSIDKKLK